MSALGHRRTFALQQVMSALCQQRTLWAFNVIIIEQILTEMLWLFGIAATAIALAWLISLILSFFMPKDF
jgi:ABC-type phosphate/phosphonate transport system permease subunit